MKTLLMLLGLSFVMTTASFSQDYRSTSTPITWLGIDFSNMKFLHSDEEVTENDLQHKYFKGWNDLLMQEKDKFDLVKATGHMKVDYDVDMINDLNNDAKGPFITNNGSEFNKLSESDISAIVKKYNLSKSGIGLVFIVEGFSKSKEEANIWVTYIDMGSKSVLKTVRVSPQPGGFGFRNYWAGAIYKVFKKFPI